MNEARSRRKEPKLPTVERVIRGLDDVQLVPTPVRTKNFFSGEEVRVEPVATLFPELLGQPVTLVMPSAMSGEPFPTVIRLSDASVQRGLLLLRGRENRKDISFQHKFPTDLAILLLGAHDLDGRPLLPPVRSSSGMRWHCDSLPDAWRIVSRHCAEVAGPGHVLLDTTEAAIAAQVEREGERRTRDVAMRARGLTP